MKDVVFGFKILFYANHYKMSLVTVILAFFAGIVFDAVTLGRNFIGMYYLCLIPPYLCQLWNSVAVTGILQSSPKKRSILITAPVKYYFLLATIIYAVLCLLRLFYYSIGHLTETAMFGLAYFGVIMLLLTLYDVIVFRFPEIGYGILFVTFVVMGFMGGFSIKDSDKLASFVASVITEIPFIDRRGVLPVIGFVLMIFCTMFFYGLSKVLYKVPLSTKAYRFSLERQR